MNGMSGDSFDIMTEKPYVTPGITVTSINQKVTIICHDTIIKNLNLNLLLGLVFKLLETTDTKV